VTTPNATTNTTTTTIRGNYYNYHNYYIYYHLGQLLQLPQLLPYRAICAWRRREVPLSSCSFYGHGSSTSGEAHKTTQVRFTTSAWPRKRSYAGNENHSPHYLRKRSHQVLYNSSTTKKEIKSNGDQEGCRLDLKPDPDES
jgi:hypothetical protein